MKPRRLFGLFALLAGTGLAEIVPHIGYVYPAGGTPGSTMTVTIGGQYLKEFKSVHITGLKVQAELTGYFRLDERQDINRVRRTKETLEAKQSEAEDELTKEQFARSLEKIDEAMSMVQQARQEDRKNPMLAQRRQFNPQIAEKIDLELTIPADAKPGDYELRVVAANGLSNPVLFRIGAMNEFCETEQNDDLSKAEMLPALPVMVNGQIMPGDVDNFRFKATKGQTLVFRADARSLVPYLADAVPGWFQAVLTLYSPNGQEIAYNDDHLFDPDPVLIYEIPADGSYVICINDSIYRGREDFFYRLSIGETPFIESIFPLGAVENSKAEIYLNGVNLPYRKMSLKTGGHAPAIEEITVEKKGLISNSRPFRIDALPDVPETEPNNLLSQSQAVTNHMIINGLIETAEDVDCFSFRGQKGEIKTVEIMARRLGSPLDARLMLLDEQEHIIKISDDVEDKSCGLITHHADARIDCELPETGTYYLRLDDLQGKGGPEYAYRLTLTDNLSDYQLRVVPASLRIPRDGSALLTVHAIRSGGFSGPIDLSLINAPTGLELERSVIPEGADSAQMVITADERLPEGLMALRIEGSAKFGIRTVRRSAVPSEDMMQAFIYRHLVPAGRLLVEVTDPDPVTVRINRNAEETIQAKPDSHIELFARLERQSGVRGPIKLSLSDAPEWLTLRNKGLGQAGGKIILDVSANAEPGSRATVVLNGSIRVQTPKTDPDYNPVAKFMNSEEYSFAIDALAIEIVDKP
jgi:hypothetical protein